MPLFYVYVSALLPIPIAYFVPTMIPCILRFFHGEEIISQSVSAYMWLCTGSLLWLVLFSFSPYVLQSTRVPIHHRVLFSVFAIFRLGIIIFFPPQTLVDLMKTVWISKEISPDWVWLLSTVSTAVVAFLSIYVEKICLELPYGLRLSLVILGDIMCCLQVVKPVQFDGEIFEFFYGVAVAVACGVNDSRDVANRNAADIVDIETIKGKWAIIFYFFLLAVYNRLKTQSS